MRKNAGDDADHLDELAKIRRPRGLENVLDKNSLALLRSLAIDSFESLSNAFDAFIQDAPLFEGDTSFAKAAIALDSAARMFSEIDLNHDQLIDRSELAQLLERTNSDNRQALDWLIRHYEDFVRACFFKNGITRDDIESARNVFHGLKLVHEKFGFNEEANPESLQHITAKQIEDFLADNASTLECHDRAGLVSLLEYINNHARR